jgi:hypothetical protein
VNLWMPNGLKRITYCDETINFHDEKICIISLVNREQGKHTLNTTKSFLSNFCFLRKLRASLELYWTGISKLSWVFLKSGWLMGVLYHSRRIARPDSKRKEKGDVPFSSFRRPTSTGRVSCCLLCSTRAPLVARTAASIRRASKLPSSVP